VPVVRVARVRRRRRRTVWLWQLYLQAGVMVRPP
jgi:hypothetical protein